MKRTGTYAIKGKDGVVKYRRKNCENTPGIFTTRDDFQRDFTKRESEREITDIISEKDSIIELIKLTEDEAEVRRLTEKHSNLIGSYDRDESSARIKINEVGVARWGELLGLETEVIIFEVRKNYAIDALVYEYSIFPADGVCRTRSVIDDTYATPVKTKGIGYGLNAAFNVVYDVGKKLYGDKLTLEITKKAFLGTCQLAKKHGYDKNVDQWFMNLDKNNGGE
jgi:hypothetical protein